MKRVLSILVYLQVVMAVFLSRGYCDGSGDYTIPVAGEAMDLLQYEKGVAGPSESAISLLNKRTIISATLLGAGIGASWAPLYFGVSDNPAWGMVVGTGSGALMGFATSNILVKVRPDNGVKGLFLGFGIGSAGGLLSGLAAGAVTFKDEPFTFPGRAGGIGLACLGGAVTGLLSGGIVCSIYGAKVGRYRDEESRNGISLNFNLPAVIPVREKDGKVYMQYDVTILSVAF